MKKVALIFITLVFLVSVACADVVKITNSSQVNVRSEPNSSSARAGIAHPGKTYEYLGTESNGWLHIKLTDGTVGYISGKMGKVINDGSSYSYYSPPIEDEQVVTVSTIESTQQLYTDFGEPLRPYSEISDNPISVVVKEVYLDDYRYCAFVVFRNDTSDAVFKLARYKITAKATTGQTLGGVRSDIPPIYPGNLAVIRAGFSSDRKATDIDVEVEPIVEYKVDSAASDKYKNYKPVIVDNYSKVGSIYKGEVYNPNPYKIDDLVRVWFVFKDASGEVINIGDEIVFSIGGNSKKSFEIDTKYLGLPDDVVVETYTSFVT